MSDGKVISLSERDVRSIASEIADSRNKDIIDAIDKRFNSFEDSWDRREKRLIEDLKREMKNEMMVVIGDFKDKAVSEAEKNTDAKFFMVLGIKTDDGDAIDALREGLSHAKESAQFRRRIGRQVFDRATTSIITLVIAALVYTAGHFFLFAESDTGKLLGVMERDPKAR